VNHVHVGARDHGIDAVEHHPKGACVVLVVLVPHQLEQSLGGVRGTAAHDLAAFLHKRSLDAFVVMHARGNAGPVHGRGLLGEEPGAHGRIDLRTITGLLQQIELNVEAVFVLG
jgi:hypothetical protein